MSVKNPSYKNPKLPEGINAGHDRPIRHFLVQGAILSGIIVILFSVLLAATDVLAPYIPFSWEQALAKKAGLDTDKAKSPDAIAWQAKLQDMSDQMVDVMELPEYMPITLHYSKERLPGTNKPVVNAFATLGGHILFYEGLVKSVKSENEIGFVLAHEMAHVKHRDVVRTASGRILISTTLALLFGETETLQQVAQQTGALISLRYSRQSEQDADEAALFAMVEHYGHAGGIEDIFHVLGSVTPNEFETSDIFKTHYSSEFRIAHLRKLAEENEFDFDGPQTPLATPTGATPLLDDGKGGGGYAPHISNSGKTPQVSIFNS